VVLYCDPTNLELYGKQIIEKLQPEFYIVNKEHTKEAIHRDFRSLLKLFDEEERLFQELERLQRRIDFNNALFQAPLK
jgi:hypothetical protein